MEAETPQELKERETGTAEELPERAPGPDKATAVDRSTKAAGQRQASGASSAKAASLKMVETGAARRPKRAGRAFRTTGRRLVQLAKAFARSFRLVFFSSLTRRIVFLNLAALAVLLTGILYLNQFREGLIDARTESLQIQGRIIAGAIAASASVETNAITIDPDKLIELEAGETALPDTPSFETLESSIEPEKVAPVLQNLIEPTRTRARIYDRSGILLLDSRNLYAGGQILRYDLPSLTGPEPGMIARIGRTLNRWLQRRDLPLHQEFTGRGTDYPEVADALEGDSNSVVRMTGQGELIVSVAVPVQRFRAVLGVLLLSTQGGDIDRIVAEERIQILRVFLVAGIVISVLSMLLAGTIATPLRRLAEAANRVRHGVRSREEIPDFTWRDDEIGKLSAALREMTNALYARIEATERFAADVSHELKNPLTSLRSAVETLPLAKNGDSRSRLMGIIQHDIRRLDRLITDISDASRLDGELAREDYAPVDLKGVLEAVVESQSIHAGDGVPRMNLSVDKSRGAKRFRVLGHEGRLGQVINNLLDNARSFVPEKGGRIDISLSRAGGFVVMTISDNGPGIPAGRFDKIFERFYTDRPGEDSFGQNSGLGLSISRQIVEAHGGSLVARNRSDPETGAVFTVRLPAS